MNYFLKIYFLIIILFSNSIFAQNTIRQNYIESDEIIANPERGFSVYKSSQITGAFINSIKQYNVTVIQRIYTIPQFNNSELSSDFLNIVESDLQSAREGGVKLVMRFSYTDNQNGADAPLSIILQQIEQLKPIFQNNYDVIAYIEAGFIGAWGEWYYSSNNLNNTNDRKTVLFSLLDALPTERCVVVRTPNYKRQIFIDDNPIELADAFNGSNKSRTGAHNDCFLASSTDFGTYLDNSIEGDKNYLNQDNMFVPQGGETCNPSQFSGCDVAPVDLARMHWSILNRDYHPTVLSGWESEGCYDEIEKNLGYRFVLADGEMSNVVKPGGEFNLSLTLVNKGYASSFNKRNVELILRDVISKNQYRVLTSEDPRYWFSGDSVTIEVTAGILNDMPEGNYELLLHLSDPQKALHDRPEYSIQLANENVWEDSTGFNSLNHIVQIDRNTSGADYSGSLYFVLDSSNTIEPTTIQIDGVFDDWGTIEQIDISPNEEDSGDASNLSTDIVDVWVTDDEEKIYISYTIGDNFSDQYFYHIFFDVDNDTSTGFHSEGSYAGIDLMIENDLMWKYNGVNGEWGWVSYGTFSSAIGVSESNRIEVSVSKNLFEELGATNSIEFLLNVNDEDENSDDDYVPNNYKQKSFQYSYTITSVEKNNGIKLPEQYSLQAYPNPFNNSVNIQFNVNAEDVETLEIYNSLGELVKSYSTSEITSNSISWNGENNYGAVQSSGVYILMLKSKELLLTRKVILLK